MDILTLASHFWRPFKWIIQDYNLAQFWALIKNDVVKKVLGVTLKFRLMVLSVPVTQCLSFFTGTSSAIAHKVSASVTQRFASCHPGASLLPVLRRPDGSAPCDTGCSLGESEESSETMPLRRRGNVHFLSWAPLLWVHVLGSRGLWRGLTVVCASCLRRPREQEPKALGGQAMLLESHTLPGKPEYLWNPFQGLRFGWASEVGPATPNPHIVQQISTRSWSPGPLHSPGELRKVSG